MSPEILVEQGWRKLESDGFNGVVGPYWVRGDGANKTLGLIVEERHANVHLGTIHGGVVMTFADIALGSGAAQLLGERRFNCVTASLNTQFVSVAKVGEFISCKPEVIRQSRQLIFIRGLIQVEEKIIASVEGIWKVLDGDLRKPS